MFDGCQCQPETARRRKQDELNGGKNWGENFLFDWNFSENGTFFYLCKMIPVENNIFCFLVIDFFKTFSSSSRMQYLQIYFF
jgi:hypothetical protein